jgi:RNA polymerase sigma factor (sigma-70 family)
MGKEIRNDSYPDIWKLFISGDKEAFALLYNFHIDALYHYGTKICKDEDTVKDTLQELFLELYLKRNSIKVEPGKLKYWLFLALKRNLIKKLQAGRKIDQVIPESADFETEYNIEYQILERERDEEINNKISIALNQLPSKQKEVMYLRFNESMDYAEIASIMKITIESVRKQVHRSLKNIRELLEDESFNMLFVNILKKK